MLKPTKILVIGAGVMGRGIANTAARSGYVTTLYDVKAEMLEVSESYVHKFLSKSVEKGKLSKRRTTRLAR